MSRRDEYTPGDRTEVDGMVAQHGSEWARREGQLSRVRPNHWNVYTTHPSYPLQWLLGQMCKALETDDQSGLEAYAVEACEAGRDGVVYDPMTAGRELMSEWYRVGTDSAYWCSDTVRRYETLKLHLVAAYGFGQLYAADARDRAAKKAAKEPGR